MWVLLTHILDNKSDFLKIYILEEKEIEIRENNRNERKHTHTQNNRKLIDKNAKEEYVSTFFYKNKISYSCQCIENILIKYK